MGHALMMIEKKDGEISVTRPAGLRVYFVNHDAVNPNNNATEFWRYKTINTHLPDDNIWEIKDEISNIVATGNMVVDIMQIADDEGIQVTPEQARQIRDEFAYQSEKNTRKLDVREKVREWARDNQ